MIFNKCAIFYVMTGVISPAGIAIDNPIARFERIAHTKTTKALLGHKPNIHLIYDHSRAQETQIHPTIYLHGFGDNSKNFLAYMQRIQKRTHEPYLLISPAIFFDFADAGLHSAQSLWQRFKALGNTNLGQFQDIFTFAHVLHLCHNAGFKAVDLYGFSRGATTIINSLYVLVSNGYDKELASIGIDKQTRTDIIAMIKRGCITLDCPLKSLSKKFAHSYGSILGPLLSNCLIPLVTNYSPWGLEAIDTCQALGEHNFATLIHYEHSDNVVTNWGDKAMYERIRSKNLDNTYVFIGSDGGHIGRRKQLPTIFHAFKKKYGYTDFPITIEQAEKILKACQPDPATINDV